jgi:hypothetical protein
MELGNGTCIGKHLGVWEGKKVMSEEHDDDREKIPPKNKIVKPSVLADFRSRKSTFVPYCWWMERSCSRWNDVIAMFLCHVDVDLVLSVLELDRYPQNSELSV